MEWKAKQNHVVERLAALENTNYLQATGAPQDGGSSPQDPCLCIVGGFGIILRSVVLAEVESALHGVAGVSSVEAPGNVPNIGFVTFDYPDLMRDVVNQQKQIHNF